ncbi:AI-2E family transporter [Bizionia argentinensis JUB59]|uniref:AI-2E family transporter n=1 Tax=Bizionia argentinensis JUB59 TaxID=1046627 RepID=G2EB41_9FLAO|nr:AI-2E family transporter [Bizionia argentinensis]EGV44342.1 AI-2E family transporter [Bizionia argentinensis JUB59]
MKIIPPKVIRQIFLLLLILLVCILIFREMIPYLSGVLGAITIYVLLRKTMGKLVKRGWNPNLAAVFLMLGSFFVILVPLAGTALMLGNKISKAVENPERITKILKSQLTEIESKFGFEFTSQIDASAVSGWLSENLQNFAGGTFNTIIGVSIMYFMLFYMFTNRRQLRESLMDYIPINRNDLKTLGKEMNSMVRANAIGIPLVAIAQGIIALVGFLIFGIEAPFFWAVIITIGSMVPFVGSMLGIIPVFIIAMAAGDTFAAWGILLYGLIVVGSTDNLIRLLVLRRLDDVHPLITLIGVIIGIPLFGFIGLIFGPLLLSLAIVIIRIYKDEYASNKDELEEGV